MKTFLKLFILISAAALFSACAKQAAYNDDESYDRTGSRQEMYNALRGKVFAAYNDDGRFDTLYALATIVENADKDGYYKVQFVNGPYAGETKRTRDVVLRTAAVAPADVRKSQVVMYNTNNPLKFSESGLDRWEKAIVYDERQAKDGRVELEFPRDSNDFVATRETAFTQNIRLITAPKVRDPRTFLP